MKTLGEKPRIRGYTDGEPQFKIAGGSPESELGAQFQMVFHRLMKYVFVKSGVFGGNFGMFCPCFACMMCFSNTCPCSATAFLLVRNLANFFPKHMQQFRLYLSSQLQMEDGTMPSWWVSLSWDIHSVLSNPQLASMVFQRWPQYTHAIMHASKTEQG